MKLIEVFKAEKRLKPHQVNSILAQARKVFEVEPNVLRINVPDGKSITVVV